MNFLKNILSVFTLVVIIFVNIACGPDLADNPINNVKPVDTLENGLEMKIDGVKWKSNSVAKCQYFPGVIQIDAAYWDSVNRVTELIKFFLKSSNQGNIYKMYPIIENDNFAFFRYFPFSSPSATKSYETYLGSLEVLYIDSIRIKGTFNLLIRDSSGTQLNITDGKFNIKFLIE